MTDFVAPSRAPSPGAPGSPLWSDFLIAFLVLTPAFLIGTFYSFPYANHGQEIPPILKILDPSLFPGDFAVDSFTGPGPRYFYNHLVAGLAGAGLSMPTIYLLLHVLAVGATLWALITLARRMLAERAPLALIPAVLAILAVLNKAPWDSSVMPSSGIPSGFAMAFAAWGLVAAAGRRWVLAYAAFGAAALLQFLVGFLPGVLLGPVAAVSLLRARAFLPAAAAAGLWGLGLGLVYLPMALSGAEGGADLVAANGMSPMEFFGRLRVPHHWIPSVAPAWLWPDMIAYLVGGLALLFGLVRRGPAADWRIPLAVVIGMGATCLLINYLLVDIVFIDIVGKLQFQRVMPFVRLALLLALCAAAVRLWGEGRQALAVGLLCAPLLTLQGTGVLLLGLLALAGGALAGRRAETWAVLAILGAVGLLSLAVSPGLVARRVALAVAMGVPILLLHLLARPGARLSPVAASLGLGAMAVVVAGLLLSNALPGPLGPLSAKLWNYDRPAASDAERIAAKLREVSRRDEMVIIPPTFDFQLFSWYAQRPVVLNWKNVPYLEPEIVEYSRRLARHSASGLTEDSVENTDQFGDEFAALTAAELEEVARDYDAEIVITSADRQSVPGAEKIAEAGKWVAWRLPPP